MFHGLIFYLEANNGEDRSSLVSLIDQHEGLVVANFTNDIDYYVVSSAPVAKSKFYEVVNELYINDCVKSEELLKVIAKYRKVQSTKKNVVKKAPTKTKATSAKVVAASPAKKKKNKSMIVKGRVAVDPICKLSSSHHVLDEAGDDEAPWGCTLNQCNLGTNNNKFYQMQILANDSNANTSDFYFWKRWGRVGANGQSKLDSGMSKEAAKAAFRKQFRAKTGNKWEDRSNFVSKSGKYTLLQIDYGAAAKKAKKAKSVVGDEAESELSPQVQHLIELIGDSEMMKQQLISLQFDVNKQPLGALKEATLNQGLKVLRKLEAEISKGSPSATKLDELSSKYYTLIPHSYGMKKLPRISSEAMIKNEVDLLQTLGDIEIAQDIKEMDVEGVHPLDSQYMSLKASIEAVDRSSAIFEMVQSYVSNTHGSTYPHNTYTLSVENVFQIDRETEKEKFETEYGELHNRQLLWHGSRLSNWMSIIKGGLRIAPPGAPLTGSMFGLAVYLADSCSKSANYCHATKKQPRALMLLMEAPLGETLDLTAADSSLTKSSVFGRGFHSTKGCGLYQPDPAHSETFEDKVTVPLGKLHNSGITSDLKYNEFIVYDINQLRSRFLVEVEFHFK